MSLLQVVIYRVNIYAMMIGFKRQDADVLLHI